MPRENFKAEQELLCNINWDMLWKATGRMQCNLVLMALCWSDPGLVYTSSTQHATHDTMHQATQHTTELYPHRTQCKPCKSGDCDITGQNFAAFPFCVANILHGKSESEIFHCKSVVIFVMAYSLPENWDESAFLEDVSNYPELYDINEDRYSNNEHRCSVFQQIGVLCNINGGYRIVLLNRIHQRQLLRNRICKY